MAYYEDFENYNGDDNDVGSSNTGKVLLAVLLGAAAGAAVGLLLAPDKGSATMSTLRTSAGRYGQQVEDAFKKYLDKLEEMVRARTGSSLRLKGDWNVLKGQLRTQYGSLTDEDLTYAAGMEDQLIGNIQRRLGKTRREVVQLLNNLS